jgi:AcrR family transcriptional regulator
MGPEDSPTFDALLDAAEQVLRTDGYAQTTSRRVAHEAGLKQQLVYYYFQTMDDLLLATFHRRCERAMERLKQALKSDQPLRAIWDMHNNGPDARLSAEFMALANHHDGIRKEIAHFVEQSSRIQSKALTLYLKDRDVNLKLVPPAAMTFLMACISQALARETRLCISAGHDEMAALIDWCLTQFVKPKRRGKITGT